MECKKDLGPIYCGRESEEYSQNNQMKWPFRAYLKEKEELS